MSTTIATTWVHAFEDGSREQRTLLGGKGANIAEMTRLLGPDRVPAGFTITTEACVAYMDAGRTEPEGLAEQVDEALSRLEHDGLLTSFPNRGYVVRDLASDEAATFTWQYDLASATAFWPQAPVTM